MKIFTYLLISTAAFAAKETPEQTNLRAKTCLAAVFAEEMMYFKEHKKYTTDVKHALEPNGCTEKEVSVKLLKDGFLGEFKNGKTHWTLTDQKVITNESTK